MPILLQSEVSGVRTLTLNRPERRNALTPELQNDLIAALDEAAVSPTTRVLVLTGSGDSFCAGLDLDVLRTLRNRSADDLEDDARRIVRLFRTLYELPIPTIARVNGHAIAGGTGLASLCDFTLVVPSATFGYTEARIGFVPAVVSAFLVLQVGDKRARDLLLTARRFSAEEALQFGIISEIVATESITARTLELAMALMANSPSSLRATKLLLAAQQKPFLDAALEAAMDANAASRQTPDFVEGVTAFLEKRRPAWKA
jgi:methylglutaconyl-CoA hydratase